MKKNWWKIGSLLILLYTIIYGLLVKMPSMQQLAQNEESTRNVFFHVPMWFAMMIMYTVSFVYTIKFLGKQNPHNDFVANSFAKIGILFNVLGIVTGMVWARVAWGAYWNNDPKQIGAALCLLIYLAYLLLRQSIKDEDKRGRIAAVYNVFAYFLMFPAIYIIPSLMASQHPNTAGDESFMVFKMNPALRLVFYPAVIGWCLLGVWLANLQYRLSKLIENKK
jgi:heme exporter protein C